MTEPCIQYILAAYWEKRPAVSIAASVRARFDESITESQVRECIQKYTLRHHGEVVERKDFPCDQHPICK